MFPVSTTEPPARRSAVTAPRRPGTVGPLSGIALILAVACAVLLSVAPRAHAAWSGPAGGSVRAMAGRVDAPPAPKVAGAGLGCLLSLRAKVTWGDPGPGATFDLYDTNNTKVGGPYSSPGSGYFTGVSLLGFGPSFYLVRNVGPWSAQGPIGTCGN